jgi:hypothetical protein
MAEGPTRRIRAANECLFLLGVLGSRSCCHREPRLVTEPRRFPPPWSVDDPDMKLGQDCYIVRDASGHALAYVYFEEEAR